MLVKINFVLFQERVKIIKEGKTWSVVW